MPQRHRFACTIALLGWALFVAWPVQADVDVAGTAAMRAKVAREGRVAVIVELPEVVAGAKGTGNALAGPLEAAARPLGSLPFAALEVDAAELEALLAAGTVRKIGENRRVRPHLRQSVPLVRAPPAWATGARGRGQHIVVIDTGVRGGHPFLAGRVVKSLCSASDCGTRVVDRAGAGEPFPGCEAGSVESEHGTHVAGIAAGRGNGISGVAPDARLISIRVFRCAEADWEYIIRALDHVATNLAPRFDIAAVNMSLGDEVTHATACDGVDATYAALSAAVSKLRRLGIATVASTGNEGDKRGISAPACLRDVIAVGSVEKSDAVIWTSNSAANLDLLAPGEGITSSFGRSGYGVLNGTSMAAPHVAGAIAAIRSKLPRAALAAIEGALAATGRPVSDPENGIRRPRLDLAKALARLSGPPATAWSGWRSLAGTVAGAPECLVGGDGGPACWAPLAAGGLGYWQRADAARAAPLGLGGKVASAASCLRVDGDLQCFATTPARRLATRVHRGGRWQPWQDLGGQVREQPACVSIDGRGVDCVALGTDDRLHWRSRRGAAWGAWRPAGGGLTARAAPVCHARNGGLDCLVPAASGKVQSLRLTAARRWLEPVGLGGFTSAAGSCTALGADRHACFFRAGNGSLREIAFNGRRWGAWRDLGGALSAPPACVAAGNGRIHCLGVAAGGVARERQFDGRTWQPWRSLGGSLRAQRLACVAGAGTRVDCFGQGTSGALSRITHR